MIQSVKFPIKKGHGMGGFHLFVDVASMVELLIDQWNVLGGLAKPSVRFEQLLNLLVDMSGKIRVTSNAGSRICGGCRNCNKVYKESGNEAVLSISVDDCIDLRCMERSILALNERCVWIDLVGLPLASWALEVYKKLGGRSFIVSYRNQNYRIIATEFAYWAPNIESIEVNSESNPLERKDAEGPSLDESLENEEHLDVDSCDSDSPKNVNNDSVCF
ncbi:hypothetical protein Tco_0030757 [Tanacetum coccineum]